MAENSIPANSILSNVKKLLGVGSDYEVFDVDVITHINTTFSILNQMGVGPQDGFEITGYNETWDHYLSYSENKKQLQSIKSYVYAKVRFLFDPPTNGTLMEALNKTIAELEYRLYTKEGGY